MPTDSLSRTEVASRSNAQFTTSSKKTSASESHVLKDKSSLMVFARSKSALKDHPSTTENASLLSVPLLKRRTRREFASQLAAQNTSPSRPTSAKEFHAQPETSSRTESASLSDAQNSTSSTVALARELLALKAGL